MNAFRQQAPIASLNTCTVLFSSSFTWSTTILSLESSFLLGLELILFLESSAISIRCVHVSSVIFLLSCCYSSAYFAVHITNQRNIHSLRLSWSLAFPSRRSNRWKSIINKHQPHTTATRTTKTTKHCARDRLSHSHYLRTCSQAAPRFNSSANDENMRKKTRRRRKANVLKFIWKGCAFCSFQLALKTKAISLNLCIDVNENITTDQRVCDRATHRNCQTKQDTNQKSHDETPHRQNSLSIWAKGKRWAQRM